MNPKFDDILVNYITKDFLIFENILSDIRSSKGKIIEIIGKQGSGKSFICRKLIDYSQKNKGSYQLYIPAIFKFNHFQEIVKLLTDISNVEYDEIVQNSQKYQLKNNFDFFFYFIEQLIERDLLKDRTIIIYEKHYLDDYTTDFIHYINEYVKNKLINFIIFTREKTFTFSKKYELPIPTTQDLKSILKELFPESHKDFNVESEILHKITKGNFFQIGFILHDLTAKNIKQKITDFLDKKVTTTEIINEKIKHLSAGHKKLLITIFLLDTYASLENLQNFFKKKELESGLKKLYAETLIFEENKVYYIRKTSILKDYFFALPSKEKKIHYKRVLPQIDESLRAEFQLTFQEEDLDNYQQIIDYLRNICDYQNLVIIYQKYLNNISDNERKISINTKLGIAYKNMNKLDTAAEYFRQALKKCLKINKPADDIIFYLAETLHHLNSSAYALEVIKKYSAKSDNAFLKTKILLLKAEIQLEKEDFSSALKTIEEASYFSDQIEDRELNNIIKADQKKIKGKIFYYSDQRSKATGEFEESEKLYKKADSNAGLAAIYNNLAVLAMFRGENHHAESLFKKSLKFEAERFNLHGMSVCYSNLGSLYEDRADYQKSLDSLDKGLRIQKLLGDRFSVINIYLNIGVTYMDNGNFKKAETALMNSMKIALESNLQKSVIATHNNLGALYFKWGNFSAAIKHNEEAIKKSKDLNFYEGMVQSYNNIGELYEKRGEYNLAYDFYIKGKDLLSKCSDEFIKSELKGNLGSVLTRLHQFKDAYSCLVESFDFFKSLNAKAKIIEGSQKQAIYFIFTRNFESANYYIDSALELAEEIENEYQIGKCYYLKAQVEKDDQEQALNYLQQAIEKFVKTNNNYDLALANYDFANVLFKIKEDWEQALQILQNNKKIIKKFEAINLLEKNDLLIQKIKKKFANELKESKLQEDLLNKFYNVTQEIKDISDFDLMLETALDKLIDFADADGGLFALYYNAKVKDAWEYLIMNNISNKNEDFPTLMKICEDTYYSGNNKNLKQPHQAPQYNNLISFPLTVRNDKKGVIMLFIKRGSHYFTEKMVNLICALCNQIIVIVENISYEKLQKSHNMIREQLEASSSFPNIIGKSEKIQQIFRMIDKIKNSPTTVLLEGPSGTGKELIARAIHFNSKRRNKQFIAQYCGALPETLLESELFGHIKGSFTGATHDKKGLFEIADGGTFFLDEIADISLSTQAKLLRFLQEGEIKRVGSTHTQKVDVRVICATNVSLKDRVDAGEFRLDLYYRLNVIRMEVPSLKERKSDIPLLAIHFLDKYCKKIGRQINGITDEAMKYLKNYDWPGNIRQLENELERVVTLSEDNTSVRSSDLSEEILRFQENKETLSLLEKEAGQSNMEEKAQNILEMNSLKDAVEELEKDMILRVLKENDGNQTQSAKQLGLSRQGLIKKMQRYNLPKKV